MGGSACPAPVCLAPAQDSPIDGGRTTRPPSRPIADRDSGEAARRRPGPYRPDRPLEPPEFDNALDDAEPDGPEGDESGRTPAGGQSDDEAMGGESAGVTEEPDPIGDDLLVGAVAPDH
jgi:hypothetical protein